MNYDPKSSRVEVSFRPNVSFPLSMNRGVKAPNPKLQIPKKLLAPNLNGLPIRIGGTVWCVRPRAGRRSKAGSPLRSAPALHSWDSESEASGGRLTNDLQKLYGDRTNRDRSSCLMERCSRILRLIVPALPYWRGGRLASREN